MTFPMREDPAPRIKWTAKHTRGVVMIAAAVLSGYMIGIAHHRPALSFTLAAFITVIILGRKATR